VPANTVVGKLRAERAAALGLMAGVPVVAGTGDAIASLLGAGAVEPGFLFDLSGTASALVTCCARLVVDPEAQIASSMPSALDSMWYLSHSLFGGQAVRWFAEQFPPGPDAGVDLPTRLADWDRRGAGSRVWNQLKADILGLPYRPLCEMEFGARGAALIAGEAVGLVTDLRTTAAQVESGACVMPRAAHHQSYTEQLARYRVLVDQV